MSEHFQQAIDMTVSTMGKDLIGLVIQEIKALPDVWQKMNKYQQDEAIERIRMNVDSAVNLVDAVKRAKSLKAHYGNAVICKLEPVGNAEACEKIINSEL